MQREAGQCKMPDQSEHRASHRTPLPPFNRTTTQTRRATPASDGRDDIAAPALQQDRGVNDKRWRRYQTRGTPTRRRGHHQHRRPSNVMPPTTATHAPPSTMPHPPPLRGGWRTQDTPPHKHHRQRHAPHTTHWARHSARHDSSSSEYCTGSRRHRPYAPGRAGRQQHTPPPFNRTHGRGWTPPTHPLTPFTITQPTIDHDQRDQHTMFNQQSTNNE